MSIGMFPGGVGWTGHFALLEMRITTDLYYGIDSLVQRQIQWLCDDAPDSHYYGL